MERNQHKMPRHLSKWVSAAARGGWLDESGLNCRSCSRFFGKCCTFQPYIANYNVGKFIQSNNYFSTPLGLLATHDYHQRFSVTPEGQRGADLLCAFFDLTSGSCSRWETRPAECATYHCESQAGEAGLSHWQSLSSQLNAMEVAVAQMAMVEMGFNHRHIAEQLKWVTDPPASVDFARVWDHWLGREQEYYSRCAEWAAHLSREQVSEWLVEGSESPNDSAVP